MNIVVTGGAGFLGSHLVDLLKEQDHNVFVPRRVEFDLRRRNAVDAMMATAARRGRIDLVVHMAATIGGIGATASHPATHFYDNALMGIHVIDSCRYFGVSKLVVLGSVCAYPQRAPVPTVEENLWEGYPEATNAPYGVAKRMLHSMLVAYRQQHGLNGVYVLMANCYGPRDNFDPDTSHVIPALIRKCENARHHGDAGIAVWGTGRAGRDFLYAADAARALVTIAEKYDDPAPINVGSGKEMTIAWLVEKIKEVCDFQGDTVFDTRKPDGQLRRCFNIHKVKALGWQPQVELDEGLKRTVEWWREDMRTIQFQRYR